MRQLRQKPSGFMYAYTEALAKRPDMELVEDEPSPPLAPETPKPVLLEVVEAPDTPPTPQPRKRRSKEV